MRVTYIITIALFATVTAAGCGDGADKTIATIVAAADKIEAAGPTTISADFNYGPFRGKATGTVDAAERASMLKTSLIGVGAVDEIAIGRHVYFRIPQELFNLKKPWIDIDLKNPPTSGTLGTTASLAYNGPISMIDQLRGATDVSEVGEEAVRGTPTTHYLVTIDLRKVADAASAEHRESVKLMIDHTIKEQAGDAIAKTNVWIDKQGLLRRQSSFFKFGGQKYGFDVYYVGFGKGRKVEPPPRSQITTDAKL